MEQYMKECGKIIKQMDMENFTILMEINMRDNGIIIKLKVWDDIRGKMVDFIREVGLMINQMAMGIKIGEMEILIKEVLRMD